MTLGTVWPEHYWRDARWLAIWFGLTLCVVFWPFLFGGATLLAGASDTPSLYPAGAVPQSVSSRSVKELDPGAPAWQSEPWLQIQHDAMLRDHRIPWWDPFDGYGAPFAASQQPQPFFPLTALAALAPSPETWDAYVVARLFVAGWFAGLFVRFWTGRSGAFAAALATALSGYFIVYYSMPHLSVETLLPALFWCMEWLQREPRLRAAGALSLCTGFVFLGGMPESAALVLSAGAVYFIVRLCASPPNNLISALTAYIGGNALGFAIGAVMLVPFAMYFGHSIDTHRYSLPGLFAYPDSPLRAVFHRLVPLAYGLPYDAIIAAPGSKVIFFGWFGTVATFAAAIGTLECLRTFRNNRARAGAVGALALLTLCAVGKTLGAPWISWIGGLPFFRYVLFPKYGEAVADVAVALLCGFGVGAFERLPMPRRPIVLIVGAIIGGTLFAGYRVPLPGTVYPHDVFLLNISTALAGMALIAALIAALSPRLGNARAIGLCVVLTIEACANYYVPAFLHYSSIDSVARNPYAAPPYVQALQRLTPNRERVLGFGGVLWPNWAGAMGLDDPQSLNALYPDDYLPFVRAFLPRTDLISHDLLDRFDGSSSPRYETPDGLRWLTLSGIKYLVGPAGHHLKGRQFDLIYEGDANIFRFNDPLPRAVVYHRIRSAAGADDAYTLLRDSRFDPHHEAVIEADSLPRPVLRAPTQPESASITSRKGDHVTIEASLSSPGIVMLSDLYFPGWQASVDAVAAPIYRTDRLFRGVAVSSGTHRIEFSYRPRQNSMSLIVSAIALAVAAGLLLRNKRRIRE